MERVNDGLVFIPTRAVALDALDDFLPHAAADYARTRNYDFGAFRTNVSGLSPYLRHRLVTEQEIVTAVLDRHSFRSAEKFIQEVLWRTYWKGWLEQNPEVWRRYRRDVQAFATGDLPTGYADAVAGRTGIDAMDAWVRELVDTGYLHNHTRMWFASIWIFTLGLPWQLGADFFYRHLLDGDAASNTLSWRWVAGLQTPGKTYLASASNIARYTEGRFSPTGLATEARALVEQPLPHPTPMEPQDVAPLPTGRTGLLMHEEDLDAASLLANHPGIAGTLVATAAFADPAERSVFAVSDAVEHFTAGAVDDAAPRALDSDERPALVLSDTTPTTVLDWISAERLDSVVIPYAPVGPVHERVQALRTSLSAEGVDFRALRRRWDSAAWPAASRGFFPFREKIPTLVRHLGDRGEADTPV